MLLFESRESYTLLHIDLINFLYENSDYSTLSKSIIKTYLKYQK